MTLPDGNQPTQDAATAQWTFETKALRALRYLLDNRPEEVPELLYQIPYSELAVLERAAGQLYELAGYAYDVVTGVVDAS